MGVYRGSFGGLGSLLYCLEYCHKALSVLSLNVIALELNNRVAVPTLNVPIVKQFPGTFSLGRIWIA